jgi:putative transposase
MGPAQPLYGCRVVSPALVSRITTALNECVERFHARPLHDRYEYLLLDAVYLNAKSPVKGKRRCVLVAYGMWEESGKLRRELIDFKIARDGESEVAWDCFLMGWCIRGVQRHRDQVGDHRRQPRGYERR